MKKFTYKEVPLSNKVDLIQQLNEQGEFSWEFVTMGQKIIPNIIDRMTGQPTIQNVLIFKKELIMLHEQKESIKGK